MKRVFPTLPILSRSGLGLGQEKDGDSNAHVLGKIPTHLLAAIYGAALPFALEDDHLSLLTVYEKLPVSRIWRIAFELIVDELSKPRLSILQAALLYVHKQLHDRQSYAVADTAFTWSFMGMVVGLAHSLGLQLDCCLFGIPTQEQRIRRRLWWAVYIEDKWLSLLLGRPPYIRPSEWDVTGLEDSDFVISCRPDTPSADIKLPFRDMVNLAVIAEAVQDKL